MGTVIREIVGWLLLTLGLYAFRMAYGYVDNRQVVEAGIVTLTGWIVFHAGLQLVRTAMLVRAMTRTSGDLPVSVPRRQSAVLKPGLLKPALTKTPLTKPR